MNVILEAANWLWLQQRVDVMALAKHLKLSTRASETILQHLMERGVVQRTEIGWQVGPMPDYFFKKKGRSMVRSLTIYERPKVGSKIVGVIEPQVLFLTHSQSGDWWLVCNHLGRMGYIHIDALRLLQLD